MFSNATDAMIWQEHNCFRCWKYNAKGDDRDKMRCKKAFDIDLGYITGELPKRANDVTEMRDCPFRQEKRPTYIKKRDRSMPLFEGVKL